MPLTRARPCRGFMAPVFVPFDENGNVDLKEIPKYAKYLATKGVKSVLVNGTVGESYALNGEERKQVAEAWVKAAKAHGVQVMVHVGGTYLSLVRELARHAESLEVSSILCLPELYARPKSVNDLVHYLQLVSDAAPNTPLFYYNYPSLTKVELDMVEFLNTGCSIPTLAGLKHTDTNLGIAYQCSQLHNGAFNIFLGTDELIAPGLMLGFDSFIPTTLNFAAEKIFQIEKLIKTGHSEDANITQEHIINICTVVKTKMEWINGFKEAISMITGIKLGNPREPLPILTAEQKIELSQLLME